MYIIFKIQCLYHSIRLCYLFVFSVYPPVYSIPCSKSKKRQWQTDRQIELQCAPLINTLRLSCICGMEVNDIGAHDCLI